MTQWLCQIQYAVCYAGILQTFYSVLHARDSLAFTGDKQICINSRLTDASAALLPFTSEARQTSNKCYPSRRHSHQLQAVCLSVASHEPYCHSGMFVWMSVGHSTTYSLPRLIDHNQIWSAGIHLSSDPCKPFWIP